MLTPRAAAPISQADAARGQLSCGSNWGLFFMLFTGLAAAGYVGGATGCARPYFSRRAPRRCICPTPPPPLLVRMLSDTFSRHRIHCSWAPFLR